MPRGNYKSDLIDISAEVKGETEKVWRLFDGAMMGNYILDSNA